MEQMRSEFERWWELKYHNGNPPRFGWEHWRDDDGYHDIEFNGMWDAWQASRQAVEIEIPIEYYAEDFMPHAIVVSSDEVKSLLRAAVIRIKQQ